MYIKMATMCLSHSVGCVVVFTDFSGNEPHRQVGVDRFVTSWSLGASPECKQCGFNQCSRCNISHLYHLIEMCCLNNDPLHANSSVLVKHTLCMYIYDHCLYVCNCKHYLVSKVVICTSKQLSGNDPHRQVGVEATVM